MDSPPPDLLSWDFWVQNSATVRDLLLALAAPVAFFTAGAALRQVSIARERHDEQTNADRERRITDSFTKAIELLGSKEIEVRIGAIYVLERIARESKHDHWPIMETLTAYVRHNSPSHHRTYVDSDEVPSTRLVADIQAALTVLSRRNKKHDKQILDLSDTNLIGLRLWSGDLSCANFVGSDLSNSHLVDIKLRMCGLARANLNKSNLYGVDLSDALLYGADLSEINIYKGNLSRAYLHKANLYKAQLKTDFRKVILCDTIMPDGTVNNRNCPLGETPPASNETPPAPN